ncbi:Quino(hemo)protein alcohol dehydrogenase,PQQ-dependent [Candidatus Phaeomarinobacter ectocarpi]|uniref:Quino(Hemo)protein alcohol dehydrogenase,PQQ-dependent n=1 Tax=Candidatus Phaeomarinibacter ectocarpi TaxID=1458461 RepID=X5MLS7_9HYPH|nr:PQQ-dependent dehydrogenase, methanol/ethanol family [Candidatus Phaeomarinobacter ectocarpi]CDO59735.1 Quino(hemo)protein alcohol dehydrogenase,PQQ-dependent [Candidatus Phaeomarinobacter ectocarpi]
MSYWKGPGSVTPVVAGLAIGAVFVVSALVLSPERGDAPAPAVAEAPAPAGADASAADVEAVPPTPVVEADAARPSVEAATKITKARIVAADDEPHNWLAHGRTYSEQRYSPLDQINTDNVSDLGLAWSYEMYTNRGLEASPIVVDGYMFLTGNWGITHALDARTGEELWTFDPEVPGEWGRYGCCDVVNRGVAVWDGKVYVASFDGRLHALDAKTGDPVWQVDTINNTPPYTITGAPRVINGKVIIGNGGAELGVRGYFTAYDANTGEQLWRFYTVPGNPDDPAESPALEAAMATWSMGEGYEGPAWWEVGGGGTTWDSMVFDPELNTLYVGTGNGSPWSRYVRSPGGGDNLYLSSILAVDPDTGELKWHYQTTPGDTWDYTATQHIILADMEIDGEMRKVAMQAPKNGFFYVLDRVTGELISAEKYTIVDWASHVDLETGRPVENTSSDYEDETKIVMPSAIGGHNWHPMAFNPDTGLVYIPAMETFGIYADSNEVHEIRERWWNTGMKWDAYYDTIIDTIEAEGDLPYNRGVLKAWDPVKQEEAWAIIHKDHWNGGVLTTGGNLVFQGTGDGLFRAYRADNGEQLLEIETKTGIIAPPITYSVDGEQYVSVLLGWGGAAITAGDARTAAAAKYGNEGRLLVFKVGGEAAYPEVVVKNLDIPEPPTDVQLTSAEIRKGGQLFMGTCALCHGALAVSPGVIPDLRRMSPVIHENFKSIVADGMLAHQGMAKFSDLHSDEDLDLIYGYIVSRAREDRKAALADGSQDG